MTSAAPAPREQQKQQQQQPAAAEAAPAAVGPVVHCEHGAGSEELTAAPQLTALPRLEPLALDAGVLPPMQLQERPPPPRPPLLPLPRSPRPLLPLPRSPRALLPLPRSPPPLCPPQDFVAGTPEDVEDVAAVMSMTGGGWGPAGAIKRPPQPPPPPQQPQQQQHPPTPAARLPRLVGPAAAPAASFVAMVGPPLLLSEEDELPATPPSSPVQEEQQQLRAAAGAGAGKLLPVPPPPPTTVQQPRHALPPASVGQPTGAGSSSARAWQAASLRRVAAAREGIFVDEPDPLRGPAWLARWPVTAPQLLLLARDAVATGVHESPLLDRRHPGAFEFSAPFVGPIRGAEAFARTMREVGVDDAFDVSPRAHGFCLDPIEEGRVWFFTRPVCVFARPLRAGAPLLPPVPPTGRPVRSPPQVASLKFAQVCGGGGSSSWADDPLLPPIRAVEFTYGYVCDRRQGDTGGLGGAFGILHAAGRPFPFPEGRPWRGSWQQRLFNRDGGPGRAAAWAVDRLLQAAWPWDAPAVASRNAP